MMKIYPREDYLKKIRPFYKSDLIKVISGIRRCGKSCLLLSIVDELRGNGVPDKDIIFLNLDKRGFKSIKTAEQLEATIDAMVKDGAAPMFLSLTNTLPACCAERPKRHSGVG